MKQITALVFCLLSALGIFPLHAQWSTHTLTVGAVSRSYRLYTPAIYSPSNSAALVMTLHGLGDNMGNFSLIGMDAIADTANFFVAVPQALADPLAGTAWNSGAGVSGYYPNSTVQDIAFLNQLADTISTYFSIDPARVYVCGFSMGGFMTQRLACESNQKFAAVASVAGTRGSGITACNPGRPLPVAHFHGTLDSTVFYTGNTFGNDAEDLVDFWVTHNQCNPTPVHTSLPDAVADGYTIDHYLYSGGQDNSTVEFYKVNNAPHTWLFTPVNDLSYSLEIWKFFSKHRHSNPALSHLPEPVSGKWMMYPNPTSGRVSIQAGPGLDIRMYQSTGALVLEKMNAESNPELDLHAHNLSPGMYLVEMRQGKTRQIEKLVITE